MPDCSSCGGVVAPDGRCWDCGTPQPSFRAHLETVLADRAAGVSDRGTRPGANADALALATAGAWTIAVVCDGVSLTPRADRAARIAAETAAAELTTRLHAGTEPEDALDAAAVRAARAVTALATSATPAAAPPVPGRAATPSAASPEAARAALPAVAPPGTAHAASPSAASPVPGRASSPAAAMGVTGRAASPAADPAGADRATRPAAAPVVVARATSRATSPVVPGRAASLAAGLTVGGCETVSAALGEAGRGAGPAPACTFVAAIAGPSGLWTGWIGDSRAYWLPDDGTALRLTGDDHGAHEALAAWLGADADEPRVRIRFLRPSGPGRLLLCTDGLWRYLPGAAELRARLGGGDLRADARALVGHALAAGGHDNVTAVLIRAGGP